MQVGRYYSPRCAVALTRSFRALLLCVLLFTPALSVSSLTAAAKTLLRSTVTPVTQTQTGARTSVTIKVSDENGVAVESAIVTLTPKANGKPVKGETDYAGRVVFNGLEPQAYQLQVTREGFYEQTVELEASTSELDLTIDHQQELKETMNVVYSPPAIEPDKTAVTQNLTGQEIVNLPFPTGRDIRNALVLMPGIVKDGLGNYHVQGARSQQTQDQLDGFNITDPETGLLSLHVSADAVRSINVLTAGYSADTGKGAGGVVQLNTGMGDDRFRFSATNFLPSFQNKHGANLDDWTPRATFSGPLKKGRAWFFDAADGQYKLNIVQDLPRGQDTDPLWQVSNLAKGQVNLTNANILSGGFLFNRFREEHNGISRFNPIESTSDVRSDADMFWVRDLAYLPGGIFLENGVAFTRYRNQGVPHGDSPYLITPNGDRGSYFKNFDDRPKRFQWMTSAAFPAKNWHGKHEFKTGIDVSRVGASQTNLRRPTYILGVDGTLESETSFLGGNQFSITNIELGGYVQDRWSPSDRVLLEAGTRVDHDQILSGVSVSPRFATSILLSRNAEAKVVAGIGLYYDATNLGLIERGLDAERIDTTFTATGSGISSTPASVTFDVNRAALKRPRVLNWNIGFEKKLPGSVYMKVAFLEKRGENGLAFVNLAAPLPAGLSLPPLQPIAPGNPLSETNAVPVVPAELLALPLGAAPAIARLYRRITNYQLTNLGEDHYDSLEVTVRRSFKDGYEFLASYVRSRTLSNAVIDFSPDSPIYSQQAGGPFSWDSPNRFISRGYLPLVKKFSVAYFLQYHDGFPFSVLDQEQQLVGAPNSRRLPYYFSLDIHFERRFSFLGYNLAVRAGFNDITGRANPTGVNSNIDSPNFLTYGGIEHRVFTARLRFLGKK